VKENDHAIQNARAGIVGLIIVVALVFGACSTSSPSAPSAMSALPPTTVALVTENDCDFRQLSAIRCYNSSNTFVVLTAVLNSLTCDKTYGKQTVAIAPRTSGYFTLGGLGCGERGQVDMFRSNREGSCSNPDFAAYQVYVGPSCSDGPIPLPQPPPEPFACEPGPWGPWHAVGEQAEPECFIVEERQRVVCDGAIETETRLTPCG